MILRYFALVLCLAGMQIVGGPARGADGEAGRLMVLSSRVLPAFTIERDGRRFTSGAAATTVRRGDVLIPDAESRLLLSPDDAACDEVELTAPAEVPACPDKSKGLGELVYDLVANRYLATPPETVTMYAARGRRVEPLFSLRTRPLRLFMDVPADHAGRRDLAGLPFLRFAADKSEADAALRIDEGIILEPLAFAGGKREFPSGDLAAVRAFLSDAADFLTLAGLRHSGLPSGLECAVVVRAPRAQGAQTDDADRRGVDDAASRESPMERTLPPDAPRLEAEAIQDGTVEFSVRNTSSTPWYVYIVNYTEKGTVLPLYPPADKMEAHTALPPGATADLSDALLALESPVEYVLIAASRHKLDIRQTAPETGGTVDAPRIVRYRYVPENAVHSALLVLNAL
jgi:hypothetical protein